MDLYKNRNKDDTTDERFDFHFLIWGTPKATLLTKEKLVKAHIFDLSTLERGDDRRTWKWSKRVVVSGFKGSD